MSSRNRFDEEEEKLLGTPLILLDRHAILMNQGARSMRNCTRKASMRLSMRRHGETFRTRGSFCYWHFAGYRHRFRMLAYCHISTSSSSRSSLIQSIRARHNIFHASQACSLLHSQSVRWLRACYGAASRINTVASQLY